MDEDVSLGRLVHKPMPGYEYFQWTVAKPTHPLSIQLLTFWEDCEERGGMRMGRDVPSKAIQGLLHNLRVTEPIGNWDDAIVRLAGQMYFERLGRNISGMRNSEVYRDNPDFGRQLLDIARRVCADRVPEFLVSTVSIGSTEVMKFESVGVPIYAPDGIGRWIVGGTFQFDTLTSLI